MGVEFVGEDENVLETGGGDGCTALWVYLTPLNSTAKKMVKMVTRATYILPQFRKLKGKKNDNILEIGRQEG